VVISELDVPESLRLYRRLLDASATTGPERWRRRCRGRAFTTTLEASASCRRCLLDALDASNSPARGPGIDATDEDPCFLMTIRQTSSRASQPPSALHCGWPTHSNGSTHDLDIHAAEIATISPTGSARTGTAPPY